jgi:hypothetical protein
VIFSATVEFVFVKEFVNAIDLLGFSRCAQEGEKKANDKKIEMKPKTGVIVSNFRLYILRILMQIRTDIRPDLVKQVAYTLF